MLRARVIDTAGPAWWRTVTMLTGLAPAAVALPFGLEAATALAMLGVAWMFWARSILTRLRPRDAQLIPGPGVLHIAKAGVLSQKIAARQLCAASSATTAGGESIALVRGVDGDRPLVLELATREDALAVRRALGIGAWGFGKVSWPRTTERPDWELLVLRALSAVGWISMAVAMTIGRVELSLGLALAVVPVSAIALAMAAAGQQHLVAPRAGPVEREHLAAHVQSAAERARHAEIQAASATLAPLARAKGEDSRAWLERVDAMAASLVEDEGYRRGGLETRDLWDTLGDPDAAPHLRAIAGRVLARVAPEEARLRIGEALSLERDAKTRLGIRVALEEDVEIAARGLDRLGQA
jgi:hypothetical protein